jgi:nucleolar protein 56
MMISNFDKNRKKHREDCFKFTAKKLQSSVNNDNFIVQAISEINELDKLVNTLSRRLHEYTGLYLPELYTRINNNKTFARLIATKTRKELIKDINIEFSVGADLDEKNVLPIKELAKQVYSLFELRDNTEKYLENILKNYMPNVHSMLGTMIAAKMIMIAGSLRQIALFPASTIQMLGAETALFRHLKTGAKCPKYGFIFMHPLVAKAKNKGKAARMLADKISIAARIDYFKGDFKADVLMKELEKKIK